MYQNQISTIRKAMDRYSNKITGFISAPLPSVYGINCDSLFSQNRYPSEYLGYSIEQNDTQDSYAGLQLLESVFPKYRTLLKLQDHSWIRKTQRL